MIHLLKYFKTLSLRPENAKEIRALILELAIRGRLTEEWRRDNPDVEPASVLLERIREEKARLVKEKVIRKEKALPTLNLENTSFDLPGSWTWCSLGNITEKLGAGSTPSGGKNAYSPSGVKFFRSKNIYDWGLKMDGIVYISDAIHEKMNNTVVQPKDILLNITGGSIGRSTLIPDDFDEANVSQHVAIIRLIERDTRGFIHKLITSNYFQSTIMEVQVGVSREGLSMTKLKLFQIPLPPLPEQRAIVTTVNRLLAEVDELEQQTTRFQALRQDYVTASLRALTGEDSGGAWAALRLHFRSFFNQENGVKKLRAAILELAVQGKLTAGWRAKNPDVEPAEVLLGRIGDEKARLVREKINRRERELPPFTHIKVLPEWASCRLDDIANVTGGVAKGKRNKDATVTAEYLRVANVQRGYLDLNLIKKIDVTQTDFEKYQLELNDLLMIEGGDPDKLGRCALWEEQIPQCIYQNHVFRVRPFIRNYCDEHYLMYFINSPVTRNYYEGCAKRTTNLASINKTQMRSTPISLPPVDEQKAIVKIVDKLLALCDRLEGQIEEREAVGGDFLRASVGELLVATENVTT